jgi:hypothetical protein
MRIFESALILSVLLAYFWALDFLCGGQTMRDVLNLANTLSN